MSHEINCPAVLDTGLGSEACDCPAGTPLVGPGVLHEIGCRPVASRVHTQHDAAERDLARIHAELRDRLDALDDAQTEAALATLLRNAPHLQRKALRELSLIDHDATVDALNETGA